MNDKDIVLPERAWNEFRQLESTRNAYEATADNGDMAIIYVKHKVPVILWDKCRKLQQLELAVEYQNELNQLLRKARAAKLEVFTPNHIDIPIEHLNVVTKDDNDD